jgi:hypothetical protein
MHLVIKLGRRSQRRAAPKARTRVVGAMLALAAGAAVAEPPDLTGLSCHVTRQAVGEGMSLEVQFTNSGSSEVLLAPGPHLVWYRDGTAEDAMVHTVRASRVQNTPLVVPAAASRTALFAFSPDLLDDLRCNGALPAAAALYFYQFNPRPRFRCLLQGYALQAVAPKPTCSPSSPGP